VGPVGYTFRSGPDVVAMQGIPPGFQAVLSGHIHRAQVLTEDLSGNACATPVLYPGSTERTSFAERNEEKGYLILHIELRQPDPTPRLTWNFHPLPTRPMKLIDIHAGGMNGRQLAAHLSAEIHKLPADAVVKIRVHGLEERAGSALRANSIRQLVPDTMNVSVSVIV
jgi:DNA repair exonuclease SbcCD nuclease subunit